MSAGVIAASELFSRAARRACSVQIVIATVELAQFEFEPSTVSGTSDDAVLPKLFNHLLRLFC